MLQVAYRTLSGRLLRLVHPNRQPNRPRYRRTKADDGTRGSDRQFVIDQRDYFRAFRTLDWCRKLLETAYGGRLSQRQWMDICMRVWTHHIAVKESD